MSNKSRRLYAGFADDIIVRVYQHKHKLYPNSFTAKYNYDMLVFYEEHPRAFLAKAREREIKGWRREKKLKLILATNSDWADLSAGWEEDPSWGAIPEAQWRVKSKKK